RALATIDADEISADLHFLASDLLRGRDTPSPEQRIAARFIAARLGRLGFVPGAEDGWFWEYEMPMASIDGEASSLTLTREQESVQLKLGEDYAFTTSGILDSDVSGASIIYGGTMSEADQEGLDLEGRWVLVTRSEDVSSWDISSAVRHAKGLGALVLPGGDLSNADMDKRVKAYGASVIEGRMRRGRSRGKTPPTLYLTEAAGNALQRLAGDGEWKPGTILEVGCQEVRKRREEATVGLENVVGIWPGSDPTLKNELIIVSAHYDHVGVSDSGEVFNGADDNGSGTSAVLAVAEALSRYGPMRRSVMLMWVSGEEKGLLGSSAWTKNPYLPGDLRPVLDVNIDMVGRNDAKSLLITPTKDHKAYNGLTRLAESFSAEEGFDPLGSADAYWSRSDHANFYKNLDIPVAFLFSDVHEDYHQTTDTPDKIDYDKVRRVARLVMRMLDGLQADELAL
ncbi:MAG: hypothetical protein ACI9F9_003369, partial [Candidatus Paceibacteria bacterium]